MILKCGPALTDGPTISAAPDHLRMSSTIRLGDTYYLYCDYIAHDDPCAPGSFGSSLHLFTSPDLVSWTHHGEVVGPRSEEDSFGCVNMRISIPKGLYCQL